MENGKIGRERRDAAPAETPPTGRYDRAMAVTSAAEAAASFEQLVAECMAAGRSREEAEAIERENLGYWLGYLDRDAAERLEGWYHCTHPFLGPVRLWRERDAWETYRLGQRAAEIAQATGQLPRFWNQKGEPILDPFADDPRP